MLRKAIADIEAKYQRNDVPALRAGDTVRVHTKIKEGDKERIQIFNGTVIGRCGTGVSESFIVRRIVANEGVERRFRLHSPNVADVKVRRRGKVRRAKLYYLRDRVGKARKVRELRVHQKASSEAEMAGSTA